MVGRFIVRKLDKFYADNETLKEDFKIGLVKRPTDRYIQFCILIEKIEWSMDSSVSYRQNLVTKRREAVILVLPFMDDKEAELANLFLATENHPELWG